jgi:hypothetical protein
MLRSDQFSSVAMDWIEQAFDLRSSPHHTKLATFIEGESHYLIISLSPVSFFSLFATPHSEVHITLNQGHLLQRVLHSMSNDLSPLGLRASELELVLLSVQELSNPTPQHR